MTYKSAFDPENDPVVYTTDYGLEIRYAKATTTYLSEYTYFSAGGYNWVIIGYDPSMHEYVQDVSGEAFRDNPIEGGDFMTQFETVDKSAAGSAIIRDNFAISKKAVTNFEIGEGCVLCFAEKSLCTSCFYSSLSSGNCYYNSILMNAINELYDSILIDLDNRIIPQTLQTVWNDAENVTEGSDLVGTYKLFPLAGCSAEESFFVYNYFVPGAAALKDSYSGITASFPYWWLRSGDVEYSNSSGYDSGYGIHYSKTDISGSRFVTDLLGVRPAFVLEL